MRQFHRKQNRDHSMSSQQTFRLGICWLYCFCHFLNSMQIISCIYMNAIALYLQYITGLSPGFSEGIVPPPPCQIEDCGCVGFLQSRVYTTAGYNLVLEGKVVSLVWLHPHEQLRTCTIGIYGSGSVRSSSYVCIYICKGTLLSFEMIAESSPGIA